MKNYKIFRKIKENEQNLNNHDFFQILTKI